MCENNDLLLERQLDVDKILKDLACKIGGQIDLGAITFLLKLLLLVLAFAESIAET